MARDEWPKDPDPFDPVSLLCRFPATIGAPSSSSRDLWH
jgi:hypothetical protein